MLTPAQSQWLSTLGAIAGGSGSAKAGAGPAAASLPQPMAADCKIVRGKVPGPAHHVLCQTHNHVLDVTAQTIIAASIEDYSKRYPRPSGRGAAPSARPADSPPKQPGGPTASAAQEMAAVANASTDKAAAVERKRLVARVEVARRNTLAAFDRYQEQEKVGEDQCIISALSRAAKEVTTLGDFEDPGPELKAIVEELRVAARSAIAALEVNDFATADGICSRLDALAARAGKLAYDYSENLIDGAETAKTTVKVVDTGAKVVGGVALTVATGGAAAGVVAAEVVGTATAVSVAGGVAASTAGAGTKLALGEKVDWGMFSIDILMQGLLARFGGKLTEGIAGAVAQRLGPLAGTIGGAVIKNVAAQAVMHVNTTMFKTALETAYRKLNGHDLTLQQIYDSCIEQLTDPSSLVVLAATSAAQGHVDANLAAAPRSPAAAASASASASSAPTRGAAPIEAAGARVAGGATGAEPAIASSGLTANPVEVAAATTQHAEPDKGVARESATPDGRIKPTESAPAETTASAGPGSQRVTAHAGGEGESFQVELRPESRQPEVTRRRAGARSAAPTKPKAAGEKRTASRPVESSDGGDPMIDPDDRRMLSGSAEAEAPANRREAEEAAADRAEAGLTPREESPVPSDMPTRPLETASAAERLAWLRQRLQAHVDTAIERYADEVGLTPQQEAALVDNPQLLPAFRGSRVDSLAKDLIMQDPQLADVITAPDFFAEPDILSSSLPEWFDITTQRSWLDHLRTYQARYGPRAEPLFTR